MNDWQWFFLDASSVRLFQMGDEVTSGEIVGQSVGGQSVKAEHDGNVVAIQYDVERDLLVLATAPARSVDRCEGGKRRAARLQRRPAQTRRGQPPLFVASVSPASC